VADGLAGQGTHVNLETTRLYVFVEGSFADNKDFTSQLGFAIILANEDEINDRHEFSITENLLHASIPRARRLLAVCWPPRCMEWLPAWI
jgi:hypothetical protein